MRRVAAALVGLALILTGSVAYAQGNTPTSGTLSVDDPASHFGEIITVTATLNDKLPNHTLYEIQVNCLVNGLEEFRALNYGGPSLPFNLGSTPQPAYYVYDDWDPGDASCTAYLYLVTHYGSHNQSTTGVLGSTTFDVGA